MALGTTDNTSSIYKQSACLSGGTFAADSTSTCLATDPATNYYADRHVRLILRYAPTAPGNHTITITPSTTNGSVLPGALTLTGAGV